MVHRENDHAARGSSWLSGSGGGRCELEAPAHKVLCYVSNSTLEIKPTGYVKQKRPNYHACASRSRTYGRRRRMRQRGGFAFAALVRGSGARGYTSAAAWRRLLARARGPKLNSPSKKTLAEAVASASAAMSLRVTILFMSGSVDGLKRCNSGVCAETLGASLDSASIDRDAFGRVRACKITRRIQRDERVLRSAQTSQNRA